MVASCPFLALELSIISLDYFRVCWLKAEFESLCFSHPHFLKLYISMLKKWGQTIENQYYSFRSRIGRPSQGLK